MPRCANLLPVARRRSLSRPCILRSLYSLPVRSEYLFTMRQSVTQNLSDMWRSTFEIGAGPQLRFVTEIAPKSPFSCLNRNPIRSGIVLRAWARGIRYSVCKAFVTIHIGLHRVMYGWTPGSHNFPRELIISYYYPGCSAHLTKQVMYAMCPRNVKLVSMILPVL